MKTRTLFSWVATLFLMASTATTFAQAFNPTPIEYEGESTKFAIMVSDALHFESAVLTAKEMQIKERGYKFEIVAVGVLVKELSEDKALLNAVDESEKLGIKIVICENAMDFFDVKKSDLDQRLKTTKNGWAYMFELKDKGYNTMNGG